MASPSQITTPTTDGELLFQAYLDGMHYSYEFEKQFPGKNKRPDYTIVHAGREILFDVKDFDPYAPAGFMQFDSHPYIRERINKGRKKFREFEGYPCAVVLKNNGNAHVCLEDSNIVLGSMYGRGAFKIPIYVGDGPAPVEAPPIDYGFTGNDGMMFRDGRFQNTRISALITLRRIGVGRRRLRKIWKESPNLGVDDAIEVAARRFPIFDFDEMQTGVIVWENAGAVTPLPRDMFNGPYDVWWGVEPPDQTIVFEGEKLFELD
jgi:hypothetical protein